MYAFLMKINVVSVNRIFAFCYFLFSIPVIGHEGNKHNHIHELNVNYTLYQVCKDDLEGFSAKLGGGAYTYPTLREDISTAMISRASTGNMYFEFLTSEVPEDYQKEQVNFFFLSDIDLNLREPYDIYVNEKLALSFQANEDGSLMMLNSPGNVRAEYLLVQRDHNGDGIGAFRLTVPTKRLEKGEKAKIKVQGQAKGSNSWFMLFEATDVVERLKLAVEGEAAFVIRQSDEKIIIDAPGHFAGKSIVLSCDGKKSAKANFVKEVDFSRATITAKAPQKTFILQCGDEIFEIDFPDRDGQILKSDIVGNYFYHYASNNKDTWSATISKLFRPEFFNAYNDFFDRRYENGKVAILNSSHQDIAWVDRPAVCKILRDTLLLTPILNDAFVRSDYGFDIEDGLMLREYLERHPDASEKLAELLNRKLVSVGASYNCPYEDMYDAEDQVRQLYLGKRWVKKNFGGYDSKVYWNVDVPGKTLQYPQILKKAGVDYMVISRHAKGMFYWESPDGSSVFTYSPGHYGNDIIHLAKDIGEKVKYGAEQVVYWDQYFEGSINHTPLLSDQDMLPAIDYSEFIDVWNGFESIKVDNKTKKEVYFPDMELMTADEFLPLAEKHASSVDTIRGERPNVWIYIHGPSHHDALTASREGSKTLPAAEKFLTIANVLDPEKMPYPTQQIDEAWQAKIYPDHGWGGHDGDITDNLFKEKLIESRVRSSQLLERGTRFIANRIATADNKGIPVVLFNSLSWDRKDPVRVKIDLPQERAKAVQVFDAHGKRMVSQLTNVERHDDGSIQSAEVVFVAEVPSIGYNTYYLSLKSSVTEPRIAAVNTSTYQNEFYTISWGKGGIEQIYDKEHKRKLLNTDSMMGGDVFTMQSVGNGAGEFGDIQQPTMTDFDQVSLHKPGWTISEQGPVFATYQLRQKINDAIVEQNVTIYHALKRICFDTRLLNWSGKMYREFRTAFPIAMEAAEISYEVPFGEVKVGKDEIQTAGERYVPLCKDVHPRSVIDWFKASDDEMSVVISSSVAAFDWIDPTIENDHPLLQHILLASRRSCHWEGNEYSQAGNHNYSYILTSNSVDDLAGDRLAKQHNDPIKIIVNPEQSAFANLPENRSFISIDNKNVIISALKKAVDSDGLVLRMYDTKGQMNHVKLNSWVTPGKLFQSNILEENPEPVSGIVIPEYGIETFVLEFAE